MAGTIDHEYTDEITCPHCGLKFLDGYEFFRGGDECATGIECDCGKKFNATRHISVHYSTAIPEPKSPDPAS